MQLKEICKMGFVRYGAKLSEIDALTALWLVEHIYRVTGVDVYRQVSQHREKHGLMTMFPDSGVIGKDIY